MSARRADREPNLELPSVFGRRRKGRGEPERTASPPEPAEETAPLPPVAEEPPVAAEEPPAAAEEPSAAAEEPPVAAAPPSYEELVRAHDERHAPSEQPTQVVEPTPVPVEEPEPKPRPARTGPVLPATLALLVAGVVIGLLGSGLTFGAQRGCEAVRGTSSCGGGPGLLLLVVIFAAMVFVGSALLRALGVTEARGTSFLAVGLLTVVVMVVLMNVVFSVWMFLAVPVVAAASYVLAGWVTTRLVDLPEQGPDHDVR